MQKDPTTEMENFTFQLSSLYMCQKMLPFIYLSWNDIMILDIKQAKDKYSGWCHCWKHSSTGKTFLELPLPAFLSLVQSSFRCILPATPLSANAVSLKTAASDLPSFSPLARRIPSCSSLPQQPGAMPCAAKLCLCAPAVSLALAMFSDAIAACFQNKISQISQKEREIKEKDSA